MIRRCHNTNPLKITEAAEIEKRTGLFNENKGVDSHFCLMNFKSFVAPDVLFLFWGNDCLENAKVYEIDRQFCPVNF